MSSGFAAPPSRLDVPKEIASNPKLAPIANDLNELILEGSELMSSSSSSPQRELGGFRGVGGMGAGGAKNANANTAPFSGPRLGRYLMSVLRFIIKYAGFILLVLALYKGTKAVNAVGEEMVGVLRKVSYAVVMFFGSGIAMMLHFAVVSYLRGRMAGAAESVLYFPCFGVIYAVMRINKSINGIVRRMAQRWHGTSVPDTVAPPEPLSEATPRQTPFNERVERRSKKMAKYAWVAIKVAMNGMSIPGLIFNLGSFAWTGITWFRNRQKSKGQEELSQPLTVRNNATPKLTGSVGAAAIAMSVRRNPAERRPPSKKTQKTQKSLTSKQ